MRTSCWGLLTTLLLSLALPPAWGESLGGGATPAAGATNKSIKDFADSVKGAFGFVKKKAGGKLGVKDVPASIAVLPAVGEGDEDERRDVTDAIHNNLGTSQFALLKPHQIQRRLKILEVHTGIPYVQTEPARLAEALQVDGLLLITIDEVSRIYAGAYAHYEIGATLRLYSLKDDRIIWSHTDSSIERDGGVSLDPVGMIVNAVTSAGLLSSEATRLQVVDQLARKFSQAIPQPAGNKSRPPYIQFAMSNALEGPFRVGDELRVVMQAEAELAAQFTFAGHNPVELNEEKPGEYAGRYVVRPGDELDESIVEIQAIRPKDKATRFWRLAGRISFDTQKPASLEELHAQPGREGLRLKWQLLQDGGSDILYRLERAHADTGRFEVLSEEMIHVNTYLDRSVEHGMAYIYKVTPVDAAGNRGRSATVAATLVRPGPTPVKGDVLASARWSSFGSPYKLSGRVALGPAAELTLEPGTVLEFAPETEFLVDGRLYVEGNESEPVMFSGDEYKIRLNISIPPDQPWRNLKQNGTGVELIVERGQLRVEQSDLNGLSIFIGNGGLLEMSQSVISNTDTAVRIDGGQLYLDDSELMHNRTAIDVERVRQQPAVDGRESRLIHNQIHIRTTPPLTIAGIAVAEEGLDAALAKLAGPVTIDWQSLSGADNLELAWMERLWQDVIPLLRKQQWGDALEILRGMKSDRSDMTTLLQWMTKKKRPSAGSSVTDFLLPVRDALLIGTPLTIWPHKIQIPGDNRLSSSDVVVLEKSLSSFTRAYLIEHFNRKRRTDAFVKATRLPLHKAIVSSQVGHRHQQGLVSTVWIFHVINSKLLRHQLAVAGLLERQRANFVLAVAIDGTDDQILKGKLFHLLDQQNIPFVDLSDLQARQRIRKATEHKADLLLSARMMSSESTSTLAESIKVIDLDMSLKLEELKYGRTIRSYHRETRATAFKKRQGLQKAVVKSLQSLKTPLLADLLSYSP